MEDDGIEDILLMVAMKNLHDEANRKRKRRESTIGLLCISHNRAMGNEMLMNDYFTEVPVFPPELLCRRYLMG
jgi:hypothetical protein